MAIAIVDSTISPVISINRNGNSNTQETTTSIQQRTSAESNRTSATNIDWRVARGVRNVVYSVAKGISALLLCTLTIPVSVVFSVGFGFILGTIVVGGSLMVGICSECKGPCACILAFTVVPIVSIVCGLCLAIQGIYYGIQSGVEMALACSFQPLASTTINRYNPR